MKRRIYSADNKEGKTTLEDLLDKIDEDFDFVIAGIEKLDRDGSGTDAISIASNLSESLQSAVSQLTSKM